MFGENGLKEDTPAARAEFVTRIEKRRLEELDEEEVGPLRRGWCFGEPAFKKRMLELVGEKAGEHHAGELHFQTAQARANRILAEELKRLGWSKKELQNRRKNDPDKLGIAARLRKETTLTIKAIAQIAHLGTSKSANVNLHSWMNAKQSKTPINTGEEL